MFSSGSCSCSLHLSSEWSWPPLCLPAGQCRLHSPLRKNHSAACPLLTSLPHLEMMAKAAAALGDSGGLVGCRHLPEPSPGGHVWHEQQVLCTFVLQPVTERSPLHLPHSLAGAQLGTMAHLECWLGQQPEAGMEGLGLSPCKLPHLGEEWATGPFPSSPRYRLFRQDGTVREVENLSWGHALLAGRKSFWFLQLKAQSFHQ